MQFDIAIKVKIAKTVLRIACGVAFGEMGIDKSAAIDYSIR